MSVFSGFRFPEAAGFAILGATIGAVVCTLAGGGLAAHTGVGMGVGALTLIGMAQVPVRRIGAVIFRHRPVPAADRQLAPH